MPAFQRTKRLLRKPTESFLHYNCILEHGNHALGNISAKDLVLWIAVNTLTHLEVNSFTLLEANGSTHLEGILGIPPFPAGPLPGYLGCAVTVAVGLCSVSRRRPSNPPSFRRSPASRRRPRAASGRAAFGRPAVG